MNLKNITIISLITLVSCQRTIDTKTNSLFPFSTQEMLKSKMIGPLFDFINQNPDSAYLFADMICNTLNSNPKLRLEQAFTEINDSSYYLFQQTSDEMPLICYSGTFYLNTDNLDSLYQYSFHFKYSTKYLKQLIYEVSIDEDLSIDKLLRSRYNKNTNSYTPKLLFYIQTNYSNCSSTSLSNAAEAVEIINKNIIEIANEELDTIVRFSPRIIILNSNHFESAKVKSEWEYPKRKTELH